MKASVKPFAIEQEYYFAEGCFITELSNSAEDPGVSIARARLEPGKTTRWHRLHGIAERYVIVEGEGVVQVGSLPAKAVATGDVVIIPAQERQRISNTGSGDLVFLAICTPRFSAEAYEDLDG
ncbi:MAG: cupin domain-containing protein [Halioglobus sp.]